MIRSATVAASLVFAWGNPSRGDVHNRSWW